MVRSHNNKPPGRFTRRSLNIRTQLLHPQNQMTILSFNIQNTVAPEKLKELFKYDILLFQEVRFNSDFNFKKFQTQILQPLHYSYTNSPMAYRARSGIAVKKDESRYSILTSNLLEPHFRSSDGYEFPIYFFESKVLTTFGSF